MSRKRVNDQAENSDIEQVDVLTYVNMILCHWKLVVLLPLVMATVAGVTAFTATPLYTSRAVFQPTQSGTSTLPSGLGVFAGQLGIEALGNLAKISLYEQLLRSKTVQRAVLLSAFRPRSGDTVSLLEHYGIEGSEAEVLARGAIRLGSTVRILTDAAKQIVTVEVTDHDPEVAAQVANAYVREVNAFNIERRRQVAAEQRRFVDSRVEVAGDELRQAEEQLRQFYEENRSWDDSPALVFEEGRLRRQVILAQELFLSLRTELERNRLEEVRNTSVVTQIDAAIPPFYRSYPRRRRMVMLAGVAGIAVAVLGAFLLEYLESLRHSRSPSVAELKRSLAAPLRVWHVVARAVSKRDTGSTDR